MVLLIGILRLIISRCFNIIVKSFHKNVYGSVDGSEKNISNGLEAIPTVEPLFPIKFIGNLLILIPFSKSLQNVGNVLERYGEVCKFIGLNKTIVVLHSAPLVESLLKSKDAGHLKKLPLTYDFVRPLMRNGVIVSDEELWHIQRIVLIKTQSTALLKGYMKMINRNSDSFIFELKQLFRDGQSHQINDKISVLFLKTITEVIFGETSRIPDNEFDEYRHNFECWKECVARRASNPVLHLNIFWNLHPLSLKYSAALKYLRDFSIKQIANRMYGRLNQGLQRCILDELIDVGMDGEQVIDEVNTMMLAGHETSASTFHFLCHMIALHPEIQRECQREIDLAFEKHHDRDGLSFSTVQSDLKYLERVILETMRLFPIAFEIFRKLSTPLDIEVKGERVKLPVGTNVAITPYWLHRKREYFPEPETFNPDRFLPAEREKRHSYSYIPFSAGPRNCLGMRFAMLEIKTVAAYILRHFDLTTTDKMEEIPLLPLLTSTPAKDYTFILKTRLV